MTSTARVHTILLVHIFAKCYCPSRLCVTVADLSSVGCSSFDDQIETQQLSERFEANYHEMLSHLPINLLIGASHRRQTKPLLRALILGGGDGGVLNRCMQRAHGISPCSPVNRPPPLVLTRSCAPYTFVDDTGHRLLQHDEVVQVTIVEIDEVVMATAAQYFSFVCTHARLTKQHDAKIRHLLTTIILRRIAAARVQLYSAVDCAHQVMLPLGTRS